MLDKWKNVDIKTQTEICILFNLIREEKERKEKI